MISYIIVDDEPIAHRIIEGYCNDLPHLKLKKHCYDALEAMQFLSTQEVDLMFLDLNMPKLKGFDFLRTLSNPPKIIVTTAYGEFALEGFELNVADYLLKPFSFERFLKAINNAFSEKSSPKKEVQVQRKEPSKNQIFLKGDKKYHQISIDDILFIEAYGNYTKVYLPDQMIVTHSTISFFEMELSSNQFLRVHKSFIVNIPKIETIEGNRIIIENHKIPIGQTYKKVVFRLLE